MFFFLNFAAKTNMCLSVPGKIIKIVSHMGLKMAEVDFGGVVRQVCIEWVPEAKTGDYVLSHVGTALTLLDEKSAKESLATIKEISSKLEEVDNNQSIR